MLGDTNMAPHRSRSAHPAARHISTHPIATRSVLRPTKLITIGSLLKNPLQQAYLPHEPRNDKRRFHPARFTTAKTLAGKSARFNHNRLGSLYQSPWTLISPKSTSICIRRTTRRQVLHALRRTGKGAQSKRQYTDQSDIHCSRRR